MSEVIKICKGANCKTCQSKSCCPYIQEEYFDCLMSLETGCPVNCGSYIPE